MLGNAAGLSFGYIGMPNCVKQGSFAVVDMTEDGNYRRTRCQSGLIFISDGLPPKRDFASFVFFRSILVFQCDFEAHFISQNGCRVEINRLIYAGHDPITH